MPAFTADLRSGRAATIVPARFTLDGDSRLEKHLASVCRRVADEVEELIGRSLEALVLGGGYGRGEGGVLNSLDGNKPYNDLEFYVFTRGNRLLNEQRFAHRLCDLGERLSPKAELHVEFKVDSLRRLREASVTMFSYDLVSAHKLIKGDEEAFAGCAHHLDASRIPKYEATRLLFNRCSGLLLVKEILRQQHLTAEQEDFCRRNLAKAQLALGDALLACAGQYHWSCRVRHQQLKHLFDKNGSVKQQGDLPSLELLREVVSHHEEGVKFKLHPCRAGMQRAELLAAHTRIAGSAWPVWNWVEQRRLAVEFGSPAEYSALRETKCLERNPWHNCALNLRTFGLRTLFRSAVFRYPRERLLNALPLLLWGDATHVRQIGLHLHTNASDWGQLVQTYKSIWPAYG